MGQSSSNSILFDTQHSTTPGGEGCARRYNGGRRRARSVFYSRRSLPGFLLAPPRPRAFLALGTAGLSVPSGDGGIADLLVRTRDRQLGSEDGGTSLVAILTDLPDFAALGFIQRRHGPGLVTFESATGSVSGTALASFSICFWISASSFAGRISNSDVALKVAAFSLLSCPPALLICRAGVLPPRRKGRIDPQDSGMAAPQGLIDSPRDTLEL